MVRNGVNIRGLLKRINSSSNDYFSFKIHIPINIDVKIFESNINSSLTSNRIVFVTRIIPPSASKVSKACRVSKASKIYKVHVRPRNQGGSGDAADV